MSTEESENIIFITLAKYESYKSILYDRNTFQYIIVEIPIWVNIALVVFGVTLNSLNVIVFTRPSMKSVFNFLLAILEGINIVLYLTMIPNITLYFYPILKYNYYFVLVHHINQSILISSACLSNWLTVTVSVFRFTAVTWPLASVSLCSKRRAWFAVIGFVLVSSLILITCLLFYQVDETKFKVVENSTIIEEFQLYSHGVNLNFISKQGGIMLLTITHLLVYTVPCLVTIVAILSLLVNLWSARRIRKALVTETHSSVISASVSTKSLTNVKNSEERITLTLLIVLVLQLVAHVPSSVAYAVILIYSDATRLPSVFMQLESSKFLVLVSNCATFIVYFVMSERFRDTLTGIFRGKTKLSRKNENSSTYVSDATITSHM